VTARDVAALAGLLAAGLLVGCAAVQGAPAPPIEDTSAIVVEPTALRRSLGTEARPVRTLRLHEVVRVVARGEEYVRSPRLDWLGAQPLLVRTADGAEGWVAGEDVAVHVASAGVDVDLGWRGEPGRSVPLRVDGAEPRLWYAVSHRREWSEKLEEFGRLAVAGFLATTTGRASSALALGSRSGWGSATLLRRTAWRDLTGDGAPELLAEVEQYVTEVGYGGRALQVVRWSGGRAEVALEVQVHDPTRNGLRQDRFGRVAVTDAGVSVAGVRHTWERCGTDPKGRAFACVEGWERTFTWSAEQAKFGAGEETTSPVRAAWVAATGMDGEAPDVVVERYQEPAGPVVLRIGREGMESRWVDARQLAVEPAWYVDALRPEPPPDPFAWIEW